MISVYTDGGSRGNPGPSGIGVYIIDEKGKQLAAFGKTIGVTTNNVAEYTALIEAFSWLLDHKKALDQHAKISVSVDSQLLYSQIVGIYRVKNAKIRELLFVIREKEAMLGVPVSYAHIRREFNKNADMLVNKALDSDLEVKQTL